MSSVTSVNGYTCFNCTDIALAQKGVDPANPTNDPVKDKSPAGILKAENAKQANLPPGLGVSINVTA